MKHSEFDINIETSTKKKKEEGKETKSYAQKKHASVQRKKGKQVKEQITHLNRPCEEI